LGLMNDRQSHTRSEPFHFSAMMNHPAFLDPRLLATATNVQASIGENEATEVASFLLQLKHRSVTPENAPSSTEHLLALHQSQAAHVRDPLSYSKVNALGSIGSVYGFPTTSFKPYMAERAPALLEEPVISDMSWKRLLGDSKLVQMKDRDLVPDSLFLAMAQMKPCSLTQADRVGCYKTREIGFTGMCCKHCGGQPGFGRYYPNSVRSLAQTTTSQTIIKHIGSKCRFCPPEVRKSLLELQRAQAASEGLAPGRPRYGSRKIFFQRMWERLHNKFGHDSEDESKTAEEASHASRGDEHSTGSVTNNEYDSGDDSIDLRHMKRPKKDCIGEVCLEERESKRPRVVGL